MSLESLGSFYALGRSVRVDTGKVNGKYTEALTGTDEEQKAYLTAGFYAMAAINAGVSAVGVLLTMNDADDKGVSTEKLEQIGYLIVNLGELGYAINNEIQYATHVRVNGGSIVHD